MLQAASDDGKSEVMNVTEVVNGGPNDGKRYNDTKVRSMLQLTPKGGRPKYDDVDEKKDPLLA